MNMAALIAEDRHLASKAADDIAHCKPLTSIETIELEALADLVRAELDHREENEEWT